MQNPRVEIRLGNLQLEPHVERLRVRLAFLGKRRIVHHGNQIRNERNENAALLDGRCLAFGDKTDQTVNQFQTRGVKRR